jgi:hypothetical protein
MSGAYLTTFDSSFLLLHQVNREVKMKTLRVKGKSKSHKVQVRIFKRGRCTNSLCKDIGYHSWAYHPIILSNELGAKNE